MDVSPDDVSCDAREKPKGSQSMGVLQLEKMFVHTIMYLNWPTHFELLFWLF